MQWVTHDSHIYNKLHLAWKINIVGLCALHLKVPHRRKTRKIGYVIAIHLEVTNIKKYMKVSAETFRSYWAPGQLLAGS